MQVFWRGRGGCSASFKNRVYCSSIDSSERIAEVPELKKKLFPKSQGTPLFSRTDPAAPGPERGWGGSGAGAEPGPERSRGRSRGRRRALRSRRQPLGVSEPLVSVPITRPANAKHGGKACPRDRFQSFQRGLESCGFFVFSSSSSLSWKIFRLDLHLRRQLCSDGKVLSLKENQTDRNPCKQTQKG